MGARASKLGAGSDCQVCVRKHGDPRCPLHPGKNLTSFCSECKILVCLGCMTSPEHHGHKFIDFKECLRNAENKIDKRIEDIDKHMIPHLDNELSSVRGEINKRQEERKTKEAQLKKEDQLKQFRRYCDALMISLRNYETLLTMYKQQLPKERKKYIDIMKSQNDILRYDTGSQLTTDIMDEIQAKPNIPSLSNMKQFDDVMRKLQQEIFRISTTYRDVLTATGVSTGMDINFMVTSVFDNESPYYYCPTPISTDRAWTLYHERDKKVYPTKKLLLITSAGTVLRQVENTDTIHYLSVHPRTGVLYGSFYEDKTVRSIDTTTGITTTVIHCECKPYRIKVTYDDHVLVGTCRDGYRVYRYNIITGVLVNESAEKYEVYGIDHCPTTNRVLLSCGYGGYVVVVLDNHLTRIHTFTGLSGQGREKFACGTAVFYNSGNIMVGDYHNKEIYILNGEHYSLIHKLHIDGLSQPFKLRLYQNTLWLQLFEPRKIMCIMIC